MGRSIVKRFAMVVVSTAVVLGPLMGVLAQPASALTPETTSVTTVVNTEYWDAVALWKAVLTNRGYTWSNPKVGYYNYTNSSGQQVDYQTPCGSTANNHGGEGFYCPSNQSIYLDYNQQVRNMRNYGDGAVAFWLDHEFGHHVQNLGGFHTTKPYQELNADCLAGMELRNGYSYTGNINQGDYTEARNVIWYSLSDNDPDHGTRTQRLGALDYGYKDFNWNDCNRYW